MPNDNVQQAKSHLEAAGRNAKDEVKDRAEDLKDSYKDAKNEIKSKLSDGLGDAASKLQDKCEKVTGYVKKNPLTALGIAAAIGVGIATLLKRK
ncbi:MAG: hypothetical protein Q7V63_07565 [Gammaproteobacteria bacterium]|nr:hypothetical protein [Gammaproteobacteria bacterium]